MRAGEVLQAFALELPAAIEKKTPLAAAFRTASSSIWLAPPPRLMLATAGLMALAATQSTPWMTEVVVPEPWQLSTLTPYSATPGPIPTTPLVLSLAATVPAT